MSSLSDLRKFWEIIRPAKKSEYLEIRFTDADKPDAYFQVARKFLTNNEHILARHATQFFVQTFDEMLALLSFEDFYFLRRFKICYGINLRHLNDGEIGGGYAFIKNSRFVFFDIDRSHTYEMVSVDDAHTDNFVRVFVEDMKRYKLIYPTIVHSGGGRHILYRIPEQEITEARRRWYRKFVKQISSRHSNDIYKVDGIYDQTRVFGLPGTWNVRRGKRVRLLEFNDKINDFKFKSLKAKKLKRVVKEGELPEVYKSLEWKIMTHPNPPMGEIHNIVLFSLKLLLKEKGIVDYFKLEDEMNSVRGTHHKLDPEYGTEGKDYSPWIILNWCERNKDWVKSDRDIYDYYLKYRTMYKHKKVEESEEDKEGKEQGVSAGMSFHIQEELGSSD